MTIFDVNRRQFVVLGSVTMAGIAARFPIFAAGVDGSRVSVGYQAGRARLRMGGRGSAAPMSFVDASSVLSGDPRFFRDGARFRLHGFNRATTGTIAERIDVEMLYQVLELDEPAKFYAFTSIEGPQRKMTSNPVTFNVPVESTSKVELAIERATLGANAVAERSSITFDINDGSGGALKLNEGLYALALLRNGQPAPDWSSIRVSSVVSADSKKPLSLVSSSFGGNGDVPFDYLLLSVSRVRRPEELEQMLESESASIEAAELE